MDIIFLTGLEISSIIGIYDWERQQKQTLVLDIEMAIDIQQAAQSDDLKDTLDYKAVTDRVVNFVENSQFFLVEKLIEEIATLLRTEFSIPWVKIKLNKRGALHQVCEVGLIIERGQR
ncbi:MAG: dihydroneopterin aldolase [Pseudomonadota bacterium]|jgi:dihydroneopterin aldolase